MTKLIAGITLSLDGYMAGPEGDVGALYPDFDTLMGSEVAQEQLAETGSILMGRRMFDGAEDPDSYADDYEFQCPIVVVTHEAPAHQPARNDLLFIEFATDGLPAAVDRAKELAGDREVTGIFGPEILSQLLDLDLVDELRIDVMPVILGGGHRFFGGVDRHVDLELLDVSVTGPRTSLHLAVRR
ncbi:MAG TPA: dihydrofolate reductase family protein [Iamia sp.]|nr:dihydrofolate reductase family protein [Iamia sp.]